MCKHTYTHCSLHTTCACAHTHHAPKRTGGGEVPCNLSLGETILQYISHVLPKVFNGTKPQLPTDEMSWKTQLLLTFSSASASHCFTPAPWDHATINFVHQSPHHRLFSEKPKLRQITYFPLFCFFIFLFTLMFLGSNITSSAQPYLGVPLWFRYLFDYNISISD